MELIYFRTANEPGFLSKATWHRTWLSNVHPSPESLVHSKPGTKLYLYPIIGQTYISKICLWS